MILNRTTASLVCLTISLVLVAITGLAQKTEKSWTEWSKKEAEKILSDSPWSHTQVETNTSEMFFSPTSDPRTSGRATNDSSRLEQGATNQSVDVKFRIRFFSARPVRQALARMMQLQQKLDSVAAERLRAFAELEATNSIIVTVTFETADGRFLGKAMQAFNSAATGPLKNKTFLERSSDGKRMFIEEYVPPGKDGFGARFIFLRTLPNDQPFITPQAGEIRFASELDQNLKLNTTFKVAEMMYNGKLEY
jgi:hypothetical protein